MSTFTVVVLLSSLLLANANDFNSFIFSGEYEFLDLTYPFDNFTIYWPEVQRFIFTKKLETNLDDGAWYATNDYASGEHVGTHLDAPFHFAEHGIKVGDIPVDKLIVPLIIIDMRSKVNDDPNFVLEKHHLDHMLNDNFGKPCAVLVRFGWGKFYHDREQYLGLKSDGSLNFPGISAEVAKWIVESYKNVVAVGVDVASLDPGSSKDYMVHQILLGAGLYQMENVNFGNHTLPDSGCLGIALPMKIAAGTGAPLRLVAMCPKQVPTSFD
ncbi:hypothetical protein JYU34_004567 [Plutella xylostella]|uniref:Kynurenine formamidase n=1 Tax=Plutella xylostella TaxID=51655 RepID=A0ABQ7QYF5_PLUXY|nr:hypothetical protein JYU34_004567 [Plutella xylostella]